MLLEDLDNLMKNHSNRFSLFIVLFFFTLIFFLFFRFGPSSAIEGFFQKILTPLQKTSFNFLNKKTSDNEDLLKKKIKNLESKLIDVEKLEKDNKALRDQFALSQPDHRSLLPAYIVGAPSFVPGTTGIDQIVIDKGISSGVKAEYSVLYENNLIGKVKKASSNLSVVKLINNKETSITSQTLKSGALGIVNGTNEGKIILDNVLLADKLEKGDVVFEKDSRLLIGKIMSINKKPSSLFQSAEIEQLIEVRNLNLIFVLLDNKK